MKEGRAADISFRDLASPNLVLAPKKLTLQQYRDISNCGTSAISLLTGLSFKFVDSFNPNRSKGRYWYMEDIVKFLKKRGLKVVEVTKKSVTFGHWTNTPLTNDHCILMLLKMDSDEYSVYVMHKGEVWHNFEKEKVDALFLLNKPTEAVYVVQHPKWKHTDGQSLPWLKMWVSQPGHEKYKIGC